MEEHFVEQPHNQVPEVEAFELAHKGMAIFMFFLSIMYCKSILLTSSFVRICTSHFTINTFITLKTKEVGKQCLGKFELFVKILAREPP